MAHKQRQKSSKSYVASTAHSTEEIKRKALLSIYLLLAHSWCVRVLCVCLGADAEKRVALQQQEQRKERQRKNKAREQVPCSCVY